MAGIFYIIYIQNFGDSFLDFGSAGMPQQCQAQRLADKQGTNQDKSRPPAVVINVQL